MEKQPTREEIDQATAVNATDDETRMHTGGDETEYVTDAFGEVRPVDEEDQE